MIHHVSEQERNSKWIIMEKTIEMTGMLLIKNVWVADGSGASLKKCACLIGHDGRISALEKEFPGCAADSQLDGKGMILAPGFIDAHGHSDISALADSGCFSKISQGITTEVCGNCGLSVFPVTPENRGHLTELYDNYGVDINWHDHLEYSRYCANNSERLSLVPLCGHNTLRAAVMGYEKHDASSEDIKNMTALLETAFQQGVRGLSFGLLYTPGCFADADEINALMRTAAKYDRICTAHLRSEGDKLLESAEEMLSLSREAGLKKFHFSHLKTAGKKNHGKLDALLALFEDAENQGIRISCDRYPYTESMTQLSVVLPGTWGELDDVALKRLLKNPEEKAELLKELRKAKDEDYWRMCRIVHTSHPDYRIFNGRKIDSIGRDPAECVVEMLAFDPVNTTAAFAGMSEENMKRIIALPFCAAGSDGNALPEDGRFGAAHPRAFGAIARFIRLLLDMGISIEQTVHKVTGLSAGIFGISDAGTIRAGAAADLVIFDPDSIDGRADFLSPETAASGIGYVFKKGKIIYTSRS